MTAVSRSDGPTHGPSEFSAPQNAEAEESILGALMLSRQAVVVAAEEVGETDFYRKSHGRIFRAALTLHARGEPIDAITLTAELEHRGELEEVGGRMRISELAALVPAAANVRHYCRLVHDCAKRRALLVDLQRVSQQVLSGEWQADEAAESLRAVADARSRSSDITPSIRVLSLQEFVEQPLADTEAIIGEGKDRVLVPKSLNILGGPGGIGKTTLALHLVFHLATGRDWIGMKVQRPVRILLLENEGPHDLFAEKVKEMRARWDGDANLLDENVVVHDAPWGHFSWDDPRKSSELRAVARDFEADFIFANPLNRLGMKGAGTPEETNVFLDLLTRGGLHDDFGVFIIHHTRKQQVPPGKRQQNGSPEGVGLDELSGAWGPHPDLVMMLQADGTRRVKLSLPKVRWGEQGTHGPFVLYFEEDEERPIGYRTTELSERVDDGKLITRIDKVLGGGALTMTEIKKRCTGNNARITDAVHNGVKTGRYSALPGYPVSFSLADQDEPQLEVGA